MAFHKLIALDIETLGTGVQAMIFQMGIAYCVWDSGKEMVIPESIGAKYWQWDKGNPPLQVHQQGLDAALGFIDAATMAWHFKNAGVYRDFLEKPLMLLGDLRRVDPEWAASDILRHVDNETRDAGFPVHLIAQNLEFDAAMSAFGQADKDWYDFRQTIDIRTLQVIGLLPAKLPNKTHNALEDAAAELEAVVGLLKEGKIKL
jgi:hypothetical protein